LTGLASPVKVGEVYRATGTKLNREVAIKVLPDSFAADPGRLARFTREAQVLAALNHPNTAKAHPLRRRPSRLVVNWTAGLRK
jgi:serine/threonine-protein kinase